MSALLLLLFVLACAGPSPPPSAEPTPSGVQAKGVALSRIEVLDPAGRVLATQRADPAVDTLALSLPWPGSGSYQARITDAEGVHTLDLKVDLSPLLWWVEAPVGQTRQALQDNGSLTLALPEETTASALILQAQSDGEIQVKLGSQTYSRTLRAGEPWSLPLDLVPGQPLDLVATAQGESLRSTLLPQVLSTEVMAQQVRIIALRFPAGPNGIADPSRPSDRVQLPAPWWSATLHRLGLGIRARDQWAPWAWQAVEIENTGPEAVNLVLRSLILELDGSPAQAFRPRVREADDGSGRVSVLLRVPAGGRATAALPLFVNEAMLGLDQARSKKWTQQLELIPLGSTRPLHTERRPLHVSRGNSVASLGLVLALLAAVGGTALLLIRGKKWLAAPTSELMSIALFGSLSFTVGAAGRLLTTGVATVLGPFAVFLTALVDDCLRYSLLATLLTLLPKPGTAALYLLTGWLLSGVVLGAFTPTDLLFVGGRVLWLEGALYLFGITRSRSWLDAGPAARWLRLGLALALASVASSATGMVLHVVLYRLFLAPWYVAGVLIGPGFLYVLLACAAALPFADSLRKIQR
ncbi:MAG: hypothetical protein ACI9VR_000296 [Cognaticolwellia sp.]